MDAVGQISNAFEKRKHSPPRQTHTKYYPDFCR